MSEERKAGATENRCILAEPAAGVKDIGSRGVYPRPIRLGLPLRWRRDEVERIAREGLQAPS